MLHTSSSGLSFCFAWRSPNSIISVGFDFGESSEAAFQSEAPIIDKELMHTYE